jgi:hypothetical protein
MAADRLQGSVFTSPAGTNQIESLTMYGSANSPGNNAKGVVVLNSNLNIITNGIGNAVLLTSSVGWRTSTLSTPAAISASTDYALMAVGTGDGIYVYYDATGGVHQNDNTNSYASPINPTDATGGTRYFSIYATYTAAGGGTVQPNHLMSLMGCGN